MRRHVLDTLPIPDPATEARQIVWAGMSEIIYDFLSDEERKRLGPSPFPALLGGERDKQIHVLVDEKRDITFVSPEADRTVRAYDQVVMQMRVELMAGLSVLPVKSIAMTLNDVL